MGQIKNIKLHIVTDIKNLKMEVSSFSEFEVDDRLLKAVSKLQWSQPTPVQKKAIPLALQGKDIIIRAQTGSGKTGAYMIPLIEKLLKDKSTNSSDDTHPFHLVLVPSKELCKQAYRNCVDLLAYCSKLISVVDIGNAQVNSSAHLVSSADIIISTPSKLLAHVNNKTLDLQMLRFLAIDEADVMFSYGYEHDFKLLVDHLPKIYQALLVSATLSNDVQNLKGLILHNPITLQLEESDVPDEEKLKQYVVRCEADDKFLLGYALFKLNLIRGKSLIFVNSIDRCYRLKLFLEQFYIRTCVLNAELPQSVRVHVVDEFNRGVYDIVIATDDSISMETNVSVPRPKPKKKKSSKKDDKEFNVARGIDFQDVDNVLNIDFPTDPKNYVHRIGRTARGYNTGTALSFVASEEDSSSLKKVEEHLKCGSNCVLTPYNFKVEEIDGLRYRVTDVFNKITKIKVREARLKEIKSEIYNSEKLKTYFEENPKELRILKHDKVLAPQEQQPHMKNIPEYLVPDALKHVLLKPKRKRKQQHVPFHNKNKKRANDPLKTYKVAKKK